MDWSTLFTPEAVATYITAGFGLVFGVIGFFVSRWITRKKTKRVLFIKDSGAELLKVAPNVKNQIQVTYKNNPIDSLYQTIFEVRNYSDDVIDDIYIRVQFEDPNIVDINELTTELFGKFNVSQAPEDGALEVSISYLNQYKLYKNYLRISVIALKPVKVKSVWGGGREWAVEFYDFEKLYKDLFNDAILVASNPLSAISFIFRNLPSFIKLFRL